MTTDTAQVKGTDKAITPEDATLKGKVTSPAPSEPTQGKTYSQQEVDRLLNLTKMESGRERKATELERDSFKSQVQERDTKLTNIQDELGSLEKRIDELSSDNPEINSLEKRAKQLREQERQIKTDTATLEAERQKHAQTLTEIQEIDQAVTVWQIADMYSGGNDDKQAAIADKLIELAQSLGATTEEKIRSIANTLYGDPGGEVGEPAAPFVGRQAGGQGFTRDRKNPTKTLEHAFQQLKQRT